MALVDGENTVLARHRVPTPCKGSIADALAKLIAEFECEPDYSAVVAVPGLIDYERRRALWAPHLPPAWITELAEDHLTSRLCRRVSVANDADLAAVGETYFGAGTDANEVVFVTVSTGIGAGVLLNRRLVHGHRSIAEIGHTIIDRYGSDRYEDQSDWATEQRLCAPQISSTVCQSSYMGDQAHPFGPFGPMRIARSAIVSNLECHCAWAG